MNSLEIFRVNINIVQFAATRFGMSVDDRRWRCIGAGASSAGCKLWMLDFHWLMAAEVFLDPVSPITHIVDRSSQHDDADYPRYCSEI